MLPTLAGRPIRVQLRRSLGVHLAAASIPRRFILLDAQVLARPGEFERIFLHELFHFAWVRLPNAVRLSWESLLQGEFKHRIPGELGWSAQWRKAAIRASHRTHRAPIWRRYACESFCDSAAWRYAGLYRHDEFTLPPLFRRRRRAWFARNFPATGRIPI